MSSHVLSEVERICDRIGLLRQGELVLLKSVEEIRGHAPRRVAVVLDQDVEALPALPRGCELIEKSPRLIRVSVSGALGPLLETVRCLPVRDLQT
jgi:ABC-2 type transport system ATP-binding protein